MFALRDGSERMISKCEPFLSLSCPEPGRLFFIVWTAGMGVDVESVVSECRYQLKKKADINEEEGKLQ